MLSNSNNNNRNKGSGRWFDDADAIKVAATTQMMAAASLSSSSSILNTNKNYIDDIDINESVKSTEDLISQESISMTINDFNVPTSRIRSVFPTTDESRRTVYRSGSPKIIEYDSMIGIAETTSSDTVEVVEEIITQSTSRGVTVETDESKVVRREDIENEFNRIMPGDLSEAERYEERIRQLESAPLPCIDAVTGLVHIVGKNVAELFVD